MLNFKWRHFQSDIILLNVIWYLKYALSYRDLEEMMKDRGISVDYTTIFRWVIKYTPQIEKELSAKKKPVHSSWRMDETYVKVRGKCEVLPERIVEILVSGC